jgi:hypothetical protein
MSFQTNQCSWRLHRSSRIRRAQQFWDPKHLVTEELSRIAKQKSGQSEPDCCVKKGLHWDDYAPHGHWKDGPTPAFWSGPVFRIAPALEKAFNEQP